MATPLVSISIIIKSIDIFLYLYGSFLHYLSNKLVLGVVLGPRVMSRR